MPESHCLTPIMNALYFINNLSEAKLLGYYKANLIIY